eukprot:gene4253-4963_t
MFVKSLAIISLIVALVAAQAPAPQYRPVVLMHGVNQNAKSMEEVKDWIAAALPGIYIVNMEIGGGKMDSIFTHMNDQVAQYNEKVNADPKLANGFNAIGFSQGTLITRGYIERFNSPKVHNYIGWAGPQRGQFGTPFLNIKWIDEILGTIPYDNWAQGTFSPAQYWRDPYVIDEYLEKSTFLADINNERPVKNPTYAANMRSLNACVLGYSTEDKTIVPPESGWFGYYADNTQSTVVPLQQQDFYINDYIGLRTLDESGRLHFFKTDCKHADHPTAACRPFFTNFTLPWLSDTITVTL